MVEVKLSDFYARAALWHNDVFLSPETYLIFEKRFKKVAHDAMMFLSSEIILTFKTTSNCGCCYCFITMDCNITNVEAATVCCKDDLLKWV